MRQITALLLCLPALSWAATTGFPLDDAVPGGVAVVALPAATKTPHVEFSGQRVMVVKQAGHWYALVGLSLDTVPGNKMLDVNVPGPTDIHVGFTVMPKDYPSQSVTIADPQMVDPTPEQMKRIDREQEHLTKVMAKFHDTATPHLSFLWPAPGPESSPFGYHRIFNGEPRSPHSGIDIAAPTGTPVKAPAAGWVADVGNYYFCGKTLTIDLGQGLFSVYCHLSEITVHRGQWLKRGQRVGRIGATGRASGPNLHWTVRLNEVPVDPHVFLGYNAPTPRPTTPPASATVPAAATAVSPAALTQVAPKPASTAAPAATTHH
ncbi:MAG TPA: peptidoglycan DD-metalloendopeptidase family protein [Gammaproteobacteria bacterium]